MFSRWSKIVGDIFRKGEDVEVLHVPCPFHKDNKPSMRVNLRTESFICFAYPDECGKGHISHLVAKYYDIPLLKAYMLAPPLQLTEDSEILPENFGMRKEDINRGKEIHFLPEVDIEYNKKLLPRFIIERGFKKKFLKEWECGLEESTEGLFIPSKDQYGRIIGSIVRRPLGYNPKYMYNKHYPRNKTVFGLDRVMQYDGDMPFVIVVEGPLDAMWLWQFGYPAVALLGGVLSIPQKLLLTKIPTKELVLCFDNDETGVKVSNTAERELGIFFFISKINLPKEYKDIQEVKEERLIHQFIEGRSSILL